MIFDLLARESLRAFGRLTQCDRPRADGVGRGGGEGGFPELVNSNIILENLGLLEARRG